VIRVNKLVELQIASVSAWHSGPIVNEGADFARLVLANHEINFRLWHEEDQARHPSATDAQIASVKRAIDRLNQMRSDSIEQMDDAVSQWLAQSLKTTPSESMNTETPGSALDRLSILSLRIYHLAEEATRVDAVDAARARAANSLRIATQQRDNLSASLQQLIDELAVGTKRHQSFRQLKMYNDPNLNPVIYRHLP
jgi:selenocysteine lyase/cysteine desulfurase